MQESSAYLSLLPSEKLSTNRVVPLRLSYSCVSRQRYGDSAVAVAWISNTNCKDIHYVGIKIN
jgi:hypothetical protein